MQWRTNKQIIQKIYSCDSLPQDLLAYTLLSRVLTVEKQQLPLKGRISSYIHPCDISRSVGAVYTGFMGAVDHTAVAIAGFIPNRSQAGQRLCTGPRLLARSLSPHDSLQFSQNESFQLDVLATCMPFFLVGNGYR